MSNLFCTICGKDIGPFSDCECAPKSAGRWEAQPSKLVDDGAFLGKNYCFISTNKKFASLRILKEDLIDRIPYDQDSFVGFSFEQ